MLFQDQVFLRSFHSFFFISSGGIVMFLFSLIMSNCQDHVLFVLIHLSEVLCHLFKFFHLIKFCLSFHPECYLKSFLPIVPFFQYYWRQCVVVFIKYHPIFSSSCSIPSMFNRSAARILPLSSCFNRSGFEFYPVH